MPKEKMVTLNLTDDEAKVVYYAIRESRFPGHAAHLVANVLAMLPDYVDDAQRSGPKPVQ